MFKSQNANFFRTQQNNINNGTEATSELLREQARTSKIDAKNYRFGGPRFWMDLGRIWGGFGEAKILDVRTCFVIFSMQNLKCKLEGPKIEKKKRSTREVGHAFWRSVLPWGGRIYDGGRPALSLNFKPDLEIGILG